MKNRIKNQFLGFLNTPPLWKGRYLGISQFGIDFPKYIEQKNPEEELTSFSNSLVLGKRIEQFFELLLNYSPRYELLANNFQISRDKITLGEIDFLVNDLGSNQIFHLELVYKFYVYDPSFSSEEARWIGPNRKDTFLKKVTKLKEKQFPLLFEPECREILKMHNLVAEELHQQSCFLAHLFLPKHFQQKIFPGINKDCIAGIWLYFDEFDSPEYKNFGFYLPQKQDWPIAPYVGETWYGFDEIKEQIKHSHSKKKSPLLWVKRSATDFERIFVVWW